MRLEAHEKVVAKLKPCSGSLHLVPGTSFRQPPDFGFNPTPEAKRPKACLVGQHRSDTSDWLLFVCTLASLSKYYQA